jgi:carboxyl-terminal processing protease
VARVGFYLALPVLNMLNKGSLVMKTAAMPSKALLLITTAVLSLGVGLGLGLGLAPVAAQQSGSSRIQNALGAKAAPANDAETYRKLDQLMEVFERVRAEYVERVDDARLLEGAINGMMAALDPHSAYMDARDFERMRDLTEGEYGGLGIEITMEEGVIKVVTPIDETPAQRAGIKSGDYITHINKEPIFGLTQQEAVDKMRGPVRTSITITVVRKGVEKPFDITLVRESISPARVRSELKEGNVGYIRIPQFNKKTGEQVRQAVSALQRQAGKQVLGFVVDMRSNPGGLLDQAIEVSDAFLESGEIVSQRGRQAQDFQRYFARSGDVTEGKPIVVLVNEASASAAEIVAGALQDHRRGVVLGRRTFGKGSVQTLIPLSPETALRLTTARYYTPSGRSVQEQGIEPDIDVAQLSADQKPNDERPINSEADLRGHLTNDKRVGPRLEERDKGVDPRQSLSVEQLKQAGIEDFQLDYAIKLLKRSSAQPPAAAALPVALKANTKQP